MRPDCLPGGFDPADIALPSSAAQSPDDGGPAFPVHGGFGDDWRNRILGGGMSLRDAFAIAALQSLASAAQDETITSLEDRAADTARACYTIADAMLRARAATPGDSQPCHSQPVLSRPS